MDSYFGDGADNNNISWGIVYRCDDATLNVNSTQEGTFASGSTIDINITDGTDPVTPDAVIVTGNTVEIQVPAASTPVGATLMKTGQTTSYRTGDDGDIEAGRATNFTTLAVNNPFGNTNRFTDELGGQTYTNKILIDWSTYDSVGSTVLGYCFGSTHNTIITWSNAIDNALLLNIGGFSSGWRVSNIKELENTLNWEVSSNRWNYAPLNTFSLNAAFIQWSSTTNNGNTAQAHCWSPNGVGTFSQQNKTNNTPFGYIPVRTFTVTGTTLS